MKITFFSNYLTHHQIPLCDELSRRDDVQFVFVSTSCMERERVEGGWQLDKSYDYELRAYESEEAHLEALRLARESDVVIIGSAPEEYVEARMSHDGPKLTFRYSERLYKRGRWRVLSPRGMILRYKTYFRYKKHPLYMLCASAYTAGDFAMLGSYLGRCYKWGYFPKTEEYDIDQLLSTKDSKSILWVARLIDWKHPEIPIGVAKVLRDRGIDFNLTMIGSGEREDCIKQLLSRYGLEDKVTMTGSMSPSQVRQYMDKSRVFLFTSDQNEGWGAVLNEAMNSGCVVVANRDIGSVPFLIDNGINGVAYHTKNIEKIADIVENLLKDDDKCTRMGKCAYDTISKLWSPKVASDRLVEVIENMMNGRKTFFDNGPMSQAKIM